jgi:hypothetical protein
VVDSEYSKSERGGVMSVDYELCERLCRDAAFWMGEFFAEMEVEVREVNEVEADLLAVAISELQADDDWPLDFLDSIERVVRRLAKSASWMSSPQHDSPFSGVQLPAMEAALASVGAAAWLSSEHPEQVLDVHVDTRLSCHDRSHMGDAMCRTWNGEAGVKTYGPEYEAAVALENAEFLAMRKSEAFSARHSKMLSLAHATIHMDCYFAFASNARSCYERPFAWSEYSSAYDEGPASSADSGHVRAQ